MSLGDLRLMARRVLHPFLLPNGLVCLLSAAKPDANDLEMRLLSLAASHAGVALGVVHQTCMIRGS